MSFAYPYHSLEDFLTAKMLTVDAQADDGWGSDFPVKGREIKATVLFADITGFLGRTAELDPTETLAFVNHFFTWISAEALRGRPGIVDKYIGDEVMAVFSTEFDEIEADLLARRARAEHKAWLGEVEGIDLTLTFLRQKRQETKRLALIAPVDLGMPLPAGPR